MTRLNTTEANVLPFPGQGPALRALSDPKTSDEIRRIAADMVGDVAPHDITMVARGVDWNDPPPRQVYRCEPDDNRGAVMLGLVLTALLLVMTGWVAGLMTVLAVLQ